MYILDDFGYKVHTCETITIFYSINLPITSKSFTLLINTNTWNISPVGCFLAYCLCPMPPKYVFPRPLKPCLKHTPTKPPIHFWVSCSTYEIWRELWIGPRAGDAGWRAGTQSGRLDSTCCSGVTDQSTCRMHFKNMNNEKYQTIHFIFPPVTYTQSKNWTLQFQTPLY